MAESGFVMLLPVITIIVALLTKEVYMSLILGICAGALLFENFTPFPAVITMFKIMSEKVGENASLLIFLILLGILVAEIARSGASKAYSNFAAKRIKSDRGALLFAPILGLIIFVDDYFNCLTVGSVMRPLTDKFRIAREKLAYVIDATAAPTCILAPISSWSAAIAAAFPKDMGVDGFQVFLSTVPYNIYAWLTLIFLFFIVFTGKDLRPMWGVVRRARLRGVTVSDDKNEDYNALVGENGKGHILDLVLPLLALIVGCLYGMLYTGGIHDGKTIAEAFADCDATVGLMFGGFMANLLTAAMYLPRKVVSFKDFCNGFSAGFKLMTPALFILVLNWTFMGLCSDDYLNLRGFVANTINLSDTLFCLMPLVFFLLTAFLSLTTGNSWGSFGIMIPIAVTLIDVSNMNMLSMTVAAILSGSVAGDQGSPLSDTTILSSTGAGCGVIEHVTTQIPYVGVVSFCAAVGYLWGGIFENGIYGLIVGAFALCVVMFFMIRKIPAQRGVFWKDEE